ncbi:type II toxin-antitoxin system Phd/YefM family antitoxin [Rhodococcus sp. NPDC003318]|uniref:type II toxin-antitoxin system Phd/YefM family antitoxin n=1 Tax=Rhodococcus sp. NPDC003318 TaxID=3364503 RepID=UPI00367A205F
MPATTVKAARKRLADLVREVNDDTVAVEIVGKRDNAVLISAARYTALQEATFLLRSPELMESLRREAARAFQAATAERTCPASNTAAPNRAASTKAASTKARKSTRKRKKRK